MSEISNFLLPAIILQVAVKITLQVAIHPSAWCFLHKMRNTFTYPLHHCTRAVASSVIEGTGIHIYVFTHHKNNRFQEKLIVQNTNI